MTMQDNEPVLEDNVDGEAASTEAVTESTPSLEEMIRTAELKAEEHHDAWLRAKATVTPEQEQELRDKAAAQQQAAAPAADTEQLAQAMQSAPDIDALYTVASRLDAITDEAQRLRLNDIFDARVAELA